MPSSVEVHDPYFAISKDQGSEPVVVGSTIVGRSGCLYQVERLLQKKPGPFGCVYLATAGDRKYVLKGVNQSASTRLQDMYHALNDCAYLRSLHDTIPETSLFVYEYLTDNLLGLVQKDLPVSTIKQILRDSLRGLAALHEKDIVHTDIKPNNIMVDCDSGSDSFTIRRTQLADIEDAVHVPPNKAITGRHFGNWMWCSPEAHAEGQVNKFSDIFSFALVCIYAVTKRVIFAVGDDEVGEGEVPLAYVLERQISYFADAEGMAAFLHHLGDSPWREIFEVLRDGFGPENPRRPFCLWMGVDADFKDLVAGMTDFNPYKRWTAREALGHRWFES